MRPEDFFCKIRNTVNSTTDTLITLDHELFFYLQQILDIGGECDFSEVSSTVNFHKFVVPDFDARRARVHQVQRCANRSFFDDGCTF
jgi:hypothetical protein